MSPHCFIIAEAGVNHDGDVAVGRALAAAAAEAGADAVKFQSFRADRLATARASKAPYQLATTAPAESQFDMLRRLELDREAHRTIANECREIGIAFLSTPFDEDAVDMLAELGVPFFKVGSGELTHFRFLAHVAATRRPILLSTGMATLGEVEQAVSVIETHGNRQITLLHCVTAYPARAHDMNLRAMETLRLTFGYPVGFSDHSEGTEVAIAAVALGACVIEKHLTLDRTRPGPDHAASLEPSEFAHLVRAVRNVEAAMGTGEKRPTDAERVNARVARRSLVAAADLTAGTSLTAEMFALKRPGDGLADADLPRIVGRRLRRSLSADEPLSWDDIQ